MTLWLSTLRIQFYYTYPTNTDITLTHNDSMQFPAVTICNVNPISLSALRNPRVKTSYLTRILTSIERTPNINITVEDWDDLVDDSYFNNIDGDRAAYLEIQGLYMNLSEDERRTYGHQLDTMMLSCVFNEYRCSPLNFSYFHNPKHGNCFVFNSGANDPILTTQHSGSTYGLSLELYIEHNDYIASLANDAGIRIEIHNQTHMPFPEDYGYSLFPGARNSIGISMVEIRREIYPYGDCNKYTDDENTRLNAYVDTVNLPIHYSDKACKKTCYQRQMISQCGCCLTEYPCVSKATTRVWTRYCNFTLRADGKNDNYDMCSDLCHETVFSTEISMNMWPSNPHMRNYVLNPHITYNFDLLTSRENVLKLDVYYKDLNYESIDTSYSYAADSLLSDIGGQLGLWLGLSVVTLFEFVELVFDCIILLLRRCRCRE
ncbi:hypothetical protein ScPMuIL_012857 [Solemya velum]